MTEHDDPPILSIVGTLFLDDQPPVNAELLLRGKSWQDRIAPTVTGDPLIKEMWRIKVPDIELSPIMNYAVRFEAAEFTGTGHAVGRDKHVLISVTELRIEPKPAVPAADLINHPPHYTGHPSGVECIEITEHMNFCVGNAFKYLWRADLKRDAIEDLKKAQWYIAREIERRQKHWGRAA